MKYKCDFCNAKYGYQQCQLCGKHMCGRHQSYIGMTLHHSVRRMTIDHLCPSCKKKNHDRLQEAKLETAAFRARSIIHTNNINNIIDELEAEIG